MNHQQCYPMNPYGYGIRPHQGRLRVDGRGSVSVQPDIAKVTLGVTTENVNLTAAQSENATITTGVINTLTQLGIASKDIVTQSYTVSPQYDYVQGQQIFRGYEVVHTLKITIRNIDQVGQIIDAAVNSGANFVNNVNFTISNPDLYYQQALSLAIDNAMLKANTVGMKLNVMVSPVPLSISERNFESGVIQPTLFKTAEATTPIQVGELEISAQIEAIFIYG